MLSVLRLRSFRHLWTAGMLSLLGTEISRIGLFLYLFRERDSVADLALLVALKTLPGALAAPLAGVVVDRFGKRTLMIVSDLVRAGLVMAIIAHPTVATVLWAAAFDSIAAALFQPARAAAVPMLVGRERVTEANGLERSTSNMLLVAGPMAGAFLFVELGLAATLWIDAASFLASALFLLGVPALRGASGDGGSELSLAEIGAGWRHLSRRPLVRQIAVLFLVSMLCCGMWIPLAPFFIRDFLDAPDSALGLQLAAFGLGGVVGGMLAARLADRIDRGMLLVFALLAEGVHMIVYSQVPDLAASCLILASWGATFAIISVASQSLLQIEVEESLLGRVFAILTQGENLAILAAMLLATTLAGGMASPLIFLCAGLVYVVAVCALTATSGGRALLAYR